MVNALRASSPEKPIRAVKIRPATPGSGKTGAIKSCSARLGMPMSISPMGCTGCSILLQTKIDTPAAVLIRAIYPVEGLEAMSQNRPTSAFTKSWLNGPAKLTQALRLDGTINGYDLCSTEKQLYLEEGIVVPPKQSSLAPGSVL